MTHIHKLINCHSSLQPLMPCKSELAQYIKKIEYFYKSEMNIKGFTNKEKSHDLHAWKNKAWTGN